MKNKKMKLSVILSFFLMTTVITSAQSLPDSILKKIDSLFIHWNSSESPGCVMGIVRDDSLVYARGYGMANLEYAIPNTPATIFHMASVSKQFTAFAIILLAKEGKLNLDEDIHQYLPWFPDLKEKITIRHLLNHTSGIRDQWQLLAISGTRLDDVITQDHIVKLLSKQQALNFKPGEEYSYSNSGYTMLAEIVKSVTGKSLRTFTDSVIFKPLGMNNTHFHDDYTEIVKNRAYSYYRKDSTHFGNDILSYSNAGATSLFTNVNDMAKWIRNFYHIKVGDQKDIEKLTQRGKLNNGKQLSYASGIVVGNYKSSKEYSHSGADAGYRTHISIFPDLKMGFIVFGNLADFNPYNKVYEIADLFIRDTTTNVKASTIANIDTAKAILTDTLSVKNFSGNYISNNGVLFRFKLQNRKFYWEPYGNSYLLYKADRDTFIVMGNPEVKFVFSITATRDTVADEFWPDNERKLIKYTIDTTLSDKQLKAYTGTYYCPELECRYNITHKNNQLTLSSQKYEDTKLTLAGKDDLINDYWWMSHLKIIRDNKNKIIGFEVNSGRIMHLRFDKIE